MAQNEIEQLLEQVFSGSVPREAIRETYRRLLLELAPSSTRQVICDVLDLPLVLCGSGYEPWVNEGIVLLSMWCRLVAKQSLWLGPLRDLIWQFLTPRQLVLLAASMKTDEYEDDECAVARNRLFSCVVEQLAWLIVGDENDETNKEPCYELVFYLPRREQPENWLVYQIARKLPKAGRRFKLRSQLKQYRLRMQTLYKHVYAEHISVHKPNVLTAGEVRTLFAYGSDLVQRVATFVLGGFDWAPVEDEARIAYAVADQAFAVADQADVEDEAALAEQEVAEEDESGEDEYSNVPDAAPVSWGQWVWKSVFG